MSKSPVAIILTIAISVLTLTIVIGCTPSSSRKLLSEELPHFQSRKDELVKEGIKKGYGIVEIMYRREKIRGEFELVSMSDGSVTMNFYSFFGNEIGTIAYNRDSCLIRLQGKEMRIASNQTLDTLGYLWGQNLRVHDFITLQKGVIPAVFLQNTMEAVSGVVNRSETLETYVATENAVKIEFLLRFNQIKRIILDYSVHGNSFLITQSQFKQGIPYLIILTADENNYYRIEYKKIISL